MDYQKFLEKKFVKNWKEKQTPGGRSDANQDLTHCYAYPACSLSVTSDCEKRERGIHDLPNKSNISPWKNTSVKRNA